MNTPRQYSFNPEEIRQRLAEDTPFDGAAPTDFKSLANGDNFVRILPPWKTGSSSFFRELHQWYLPAPIKAYAYNYAEMGMADSDPVGQAVADAKKILGETHPFIAGVGTQGGARLSKSYLCNILWYIHKPGDPVRGVPDQLLLEREKPFLLRVSWTVMNAIYSQAIDPMQAPSLLSPVEGRLVRINKPANFQGKNNYTVQPVGRPHMFGHFEQSDEPTMLRIWDQLHDLDALVVNNPKRWEKIKALADKVYRDLRLRDGGVQPMTYPAQGSYQPPPAQGTGGGQPQGTYQTTYGSPAPGAYQPPQQPPQQSYTPPPQQTQPAYGSPAPGPQPGYQDNFSNTNPPAPASYQAPSQPQQGYAPPPQTQPVQQPSAPPPQTQPVQQQPVTNPAPTTQGAAPTSGPMAKPVCFGRHHVDAATCPKGGDTPQVEPKVCQICPWEYACVKESNARAGVPF